MPEPRLLTIKDAASYLSCAVWAIRELIWKREIPFVKIGRRFLIDRKDLDQFIEQRKNVA